MRRLFGGRYVWVGGGISNRFRLLLQTQTRRRLFSTDNRPTNSNNNGDKVDDPGSLSRSDAYKALENLDFMTASKILFATPPKQKKFGIDFHLVQLFFVCMPSLAVYLVAKYARYEMRRMEAEVEQKKKAEEELKIKAEEEAKAKEMELKAAEENESGSELREVKERLGKLEEAVKEIAVGGSKKQSDVIISQKQGTGDGEKQRTATLSEASKSAGEEDHTSNGRRTKGSDQQEKSGSAPVTDSSQQNQKTTQDKGP